MKIVQLLPILLIIFLSCTSESAILGDWQVESISGQTLSGEEKQSKVTFHENGECTFFEANSNPSQGKWELSEDEKTLDLINKGGKHKILKVVVLESDKMVLNEDGSEITFKKIDN